MHFFEVNFTGKGYYEQSTRTFDTAAEAFAFGHSKGCPFTVIETDMRPKMTVHRPKHPHLRLV